MLRRLAGPSEVGGAVCERAPTIMQYESLTLTSLLPDIDIEHCPNCGGALKIIAAPSTGSGQHRRSAGDCQNPYSSGPAYPCPAAPRAGAAIRFIPNGLRAETGYQRKPSPPLGLSSSERCDLKHFARLRLLRRPSQQKQHRDFHQTEKGLTTPRSGDIARSRKKVV